MKRIHSLGCTKTQCTLSSGSIIRITFYFASAHIAGVNPFLINRTKWTCSNRFPSSKDRAFTFKSRQIFTPVGRVDHLHSPSWIDRSLSLTALRSSSAPRFLQLPIKRIIGTEIARICFGILQGNGASTLPCR